MQNENKILKIATKKTLFAKDSTDLIKIGIFHRLSLH